MKSTVGPTIAVVILSGGCGAGNLEPASPGSVDPDTYLIAIERRVQEIARQDLWPGFDPLAIPLAIHDGSRTWLFRHSAPPEPFRSEGGAYVMDGRHPAVTANTTAEIGGILSAVLWQGALSGSLEGAAATAAHEAFHAFQRTHHPEWYGNEMDFFVYPVADADLLALRRLESEALRRAMRATEDLASACWASAALRIRAERFGGMPAQAIAYERGNELNEGLARYVERRALSDPPPPWRFDDFPAEAVRARTYASGSGIAALLDRFDLVWRQQLEANDDQVLDRLLEAALPAQVPERICAFDEAERASARRRAAGDVERIVERRRDVREALLDRSGWRLIVDASAAPFSPRFDPQNLQITGPGEVVHQRIVLLNGPAGSVEVNGRPALTRGLGEHPFAEGVATLVITGLSAPPTISEEDGLRIRAEGVSIELTGATVTISGQVVHVQCCDSRPNSHD